MGHGQTEVRRTPYGDERLHANSWHSTDDPAGAERRHGLCLGQLRRLAAPALDDDVTGALVGLVEGGYARLVTSPSLW